MTMNLQSIFLATGNGTQPSGGGSFQLILLLAIMLVFWLFMIRPQSKRAKEQKKFLENLQKGEKIVTIAGIHGVIQKVNEDGTLQLEVSPGYYIKIERSAISMEWTNALQKNAAKSAEKTTSTTEEKK